MADKAYTTLGLQRGATAEDIEEAYQRLLTECNTPCGKNAQAIARSSELREAYEELMLLTDDESDDSSDSSQIQHKLLLSFEELFRGCNKRLDVEIVDPADGTTKTELISVRIKPGTLPGAVIPFPQLASSEGIPPMVFVVHDKPDQRFKRLNNVDIEYTAVISNEERQKGFEILIPTLENDPIVLTYDDELDGFEEAFDGRGLPHLGNKKNRGKLMVRFEIAENAQEMRSNQRIYEQFQKDSNTAIVIQKVQPKACVELMEVESEPVPEQQSVSTDADSFEKVDYCEDIMHIDGSSSEEAGEPEKDLQPQEQLPPNHYDIKLSLEDIYHGCTKKLSITSQITDQAGHSQIDTKNVNVSFEPGSIGGTQVKLEHKGDQCFGKVPADVIVKVVEEPHSTFTRIGHDIQYEVKITQREAILGGKLKIPTLENRNVEYSIKPTVTPGSIQKLEGYGLPILNEEGQRGDLLIEFDIMMEQEIQDPPIEYTLNVALEQVLSGCTKKMKINRLVVNSQGDETEEIKIFPITIKPGATDGTRITFPRAGDQHPGHIPADICFIIRDKPHEKFVRRGIDIEYVANVYKSQVINGGSIEIPTLEKGVMKTVSLEGVDQKSRPRKIPNFGLPHVDDPSRRGDLLVKFEVMNDPKDEPIERDFFLTLEQVLFGHTKKMSIRRKIFDTKGIELKEENVPIEIVVPPGTEEMTRFPFYEHGDRRPGVTPSDIIFYLRYKPHRLFEQKGRNIYHTVMITPNEIKKGISLKVPTLEKEHLTIPNERLKLISKKNNVAQLPNRGLPFPGSASPRRGTLFVSFDIKDQSFKDPPTLCDLPLTLEEMYSGTLKKLKIEPHIVDENGDATTTEKLVANFEILPGTKAGTEFTYHRGGDRHPNRIPGDVVFKLVELPHKQFTRKGNDLHYTAVVTESQVINGCTLQIPTLRGDFKEVHFKRNDLTKYTTKTLANLGFVNPAKPSVRGNLVVSFNIKKNPIVVGGKSERPIAEVESTKEAQVDPKLETDIQDEPIEHFLPLSLTDILNGCSKRLRIKQKIVDIDGSERFEDKIIKINVDPGTEAGTRLVYEKGGDRLPGKTPADIIFIAVDIDDPIFIRFGADVQYVAKITQHQFENGCELAIPTLENKTIKLKLEKFPNLDETKQISGRGLPRAENANSRGDLVVKFELEGDNDKEKQNNDQVDIDCEESQKLQLLLSQDPPVYIHLYLTLENIFYGHCEEMSIDRQVHCQDETIIKESKLVHIVVEPGTEYGTPYIFEKHGNRRPERVPADVVFIATETKHKHFTRHNADLNYTAHVTTKRIKNGGTIQVPTIDGHKMDIYMPPNFNPHESKIVPDRGLPILGEDKRRGNMVIRFEIEEEKKKSFVKKFVTKMIQVFE